MIKKIGLHCDLLICSIHAHTISASISNHNLFFSKEIVTITEIVATVEDLFHEPIEAIGIDVGEELTDEIADGEPLARRSEEEVFVRRYVEGQIGGAEENQIRRTFSACHPVF